MKSATNKNHLLILVFIVFIVMFGISIIWNGLITNNITTMSYNYNTTKLGIVLSGAFLYFVISFLMVNIYVFAFAEKRPIFNSIIYGVIFGFTVFLISSVIGISPTESNELFSSLGNIIHHITEQTLGSVVLGYTLVQIK